MSSMERGSQVAKVFGGITTTRTPEIPAFSGEDAYLWVSRVEQYFHANPTMNDRDRFRAAIAALQQPAANWYLNWKKYTSSALTWSSFKEAVLQRFQPEAIHYPCMALLNLRQSGNTVVEYCDLFETLLCSEQLRHKNLNGEILMAIFFQGLKEDLKAELKLKLGEIKSLQELMDIAILVEQEFKARDDAKSKLRPNPLLEFWGEISGRKVIILVASGSSNSRIAKRVVEELGLAVSESDEHFGFGVGPPVKSEGLCKGVKLKIHKELEITRDFFVFENLGGKDDIVLGFDWLRSLGTTTMFYEDGMTMEFSVAGKTITLKGDPSLTAPPDELRISYMCSLNT